MQLERRAETLFLGIRERSSYEGATVFRPLLEWTKAQLLAYCEANRVPYGIDETNLSPKYRRNAVRAAMARWPSAQKDELWERVARFNAANAPAARRALMLAARFEATRSAALLLGQGEAEAFHAAFEWFRLRGVRFGRAKYEAFAALLRKNDPRKLLRVKEGLALRVQKGRVLLVRTRKK